MDNKDTAKRLTGAAGIVMLGTLLSRITGFLRTLLISTNMLPQGYSDEFLMAFTLPDLVYDLLAGGAIAAALIPVLSAYLTKGKEKTGWKAVSTFMNVSVIFLIALEIIFFIFTDVLLEIMAPGYSSGSSGDTELIIRLTRILLLSAPFMMMAGQFNGILNAYQRFVVAAFGPVIYNVCTVLSIAAFGAKSAELTAWGVVLGAVVFFLIQLGATRKHFYNYQPRLYLKSPAFRQLLKLAIPSLISSSILEMNLLISKGYATYYDEGMLTLLNNANRTWQLPLGVFAQSIGIALLPTLSEHYAAGDFETFKAILYKALRVVFLLSLPTSVIMTILSQDITRVMFKWGSLSEREVFFGGICLMGYSAALVFASAITLLTRSFYSIQDSMTPLLCGILGILFNYVFNAVFRNLTNMGIAGTALAYSVSSFINMMLLVYAFKKKTDIDIIADNFGYIFKTIAAAFPGSVVTYVLSVIVRPDVESKVSQALALIVSIAAGLGVFWVIMVKLGMPEIEYVNHLVGSYFKKFKLKRREI